MSFDSARAKRRVRQLAEITRIIDLRIDAKRVELEGYRFHQQACEEEVSAKHLSFEAAVQAVDVCRASINAVRAGAFNPEAMPGFIASQKRLQKVTNAKRKELKAAEAQLETANAQVAQAAAELQVLRARHQLLQDLSQKLEKQLAVHRNLLGDTLQDEDFAAYLGGKARKGRAVSVGII